MQKKHKFILPVYACNAIAVWSDYPFGHYIVLRVGITCIWHYHQQYLRTIIGSVTKRRTKIPLNRTAVVQQLTSTKLH